MKGKSPGHPAWAGRIFHRSQTWLSILSLTPYHAVDEAIKVPVLRDNLALLMQLAQYTAKFGTAKWTVTVGVAWSGMVPLMFASPSRRFPAEPNRYVRPPSRNETSHKAHMARQQRLQQKREREKEERVKPFGTRGDHTFPHFPFELQGPYCSHLRLFVLDHKLKQKAEAEARRKMLIEEERRKTEERRKREAARVRHR